MSASDRFKPYDPNVQAVVRLEEALPPEHPIHLFVDRVRSVDLGHFVIPPGPKGEKPYHPHALFGILAWGYLHGVRSARELARLARQEATFASLAGAGGRATGRWRAFRETTPRSSRPCSRRRWCRRRGWGWHGRATSSWTGRGWRRTRRSTRRRAP